MKARSIGGRLRTPSRRRALGLIAVAGMAVAAFGASPSSAHDELDDGTENDDGALELPGDLSAALAATDHSSNAMPGGTATTTKKNLDVVGRGERNVGDATTDVWALGGYAYTGTFNSPCGGDPEAGIWVWDVNNKNKPAFSNVIQSPIGSRTNDVKAASLNSGDVLVHSNEPCAAGGIGGFEIYDVDDPANPVFLAHVQVDEIAEITPLFYAPGTLEDNGVHNLWLFTQGSNDYVAAQSEGLFDGFQIFDITDPSNPTLVSGWGAEEVFDPGVGQLTLAEDPTGSRTAASINWMLGNTGGFGASQNKFLHDFTISADGTEAYLAHWDAGLIKLDISDPANPALISVAIEPIAGSLDGEVNSHSVWPSADGSIVVEGEEDFAAWEATVAPGNVTFGNGNPIPGVMAATSAGNAFEGSQTGNAGFITASSVEVTSGPLAPAVFGANELSGNNFPLGAGSYAGNFVWIGQACNGNPIVNAPGAGDIAVVRRGGCTFAEKSVNAFNAGAGAVVITNQNPNSTPWSGLRIWDYTDDTNPVLASTFNTVCSASTAPSAECAANGTYSVHNVVVENKGNKVLAYVSWYWDGMLVLDVTDPYNPKEVARYLDTSGPNAGMANDFWGVYKEVNSPFIYGSDRNGGLYIFKEKGLGTAKKGK